MNIVNNDKEFEALNPYPNYPMNKKDYPHAYPAVVISYTSGGGLVGERKNLAVSVPPDGVNIDDYFAGFKEGFKFCRMFDQ